MNTRIVVSAALVALLAGLPVMAAEAGSAEQKCAALEQQFTAAIKLKSHLDEADSARSLADNGSNLCAGGDHAAGIARLEQAMKTIGVNPQ